MYRAEKICSWSPNISLQTKQIHMIREHNRKYCQTEEEISDHVLVRTEFQIRKSTGNIREPLQGLIVVIKKPLLHAIPSFP